MTDLADFSVEYPGPADETAIVVATGELDLHSSPPFKETLAGAIESGASRVVVDLAGVTFIDSSALGALIGGARRAAIGGTELMIVCPPGPVARVIDLTGLHRAFTIYADREEALGATAAASAAEEAIGAAD